MSSKQPITPDTGHPPSTAAEIRKVRRGLAARDRELVEEGREIYQALRKGTVPARALSEHEHRVAGHIKKLMNGSTPAGLLAPATSGDDQVRAERDAIAYVDRVLARQEESARYSEAETWVADNAKEWHALCREIILVAERLAALEESARQFLQPIDGTCVKIAMGRTIGSGLSLLGIGDPLREMREAALKDNIVTEAEIQKAQRL
jgi:hypothetical protein